MGCGTLAFSEVCLLKIRENLWHVFHTCSLRLIDWLIDWLFSQSINQALRRIAKYIVHCTSQTCLSLVANDVSPTLIRSFSFSESAESTNASWDWRRSMKSCWWATPVWWSAPSPTSPSSSGKSSGGSKLISSLPEKLVRGPMYFYNSTDPRPGRPPTQRSARKPCATLICDGGMIPSPGRRSCLLHARRVGAWFPVLASAAPGALARELHAHALLRILRGGWRRQPVVVSPLHSQYTPEAQPTDGARVGIPAVFSAAGTGGCRCAAGRNAPLTRADCRVDSRADHMCHEWHAAREAAVAVRGEAAVVVRDDSEAAAVGGKMGAAVYHAWTEDGVVLPCHGWYGVKFPFPVVDLSTADYTALNGVGPRGFWRIASRWEQPPGLKAPPCPFDPQDLAFEVGAGHLAVMKAGGWKLRNFGPITWGGDFFLGLYCTWRAVSSAAYFFFSALQGITTEWNISMAILWHVRRLLLFFSSTDSFLMPRPYGRLTQNDFLIFVIRFGRNVTEFFIYWSFAISCRVIFFATHCRWKCECYRTMGRVLPLLIPSMRFGHGDESKISANGSLQKEHSNARKLYRESRSASPNCESKKIQIGFLKKKHVLLQLWGIM